MTYTDTHLRCPRCKRPIMQGIHKGNFKGWYTESLRCAVYSCDYLEDKQHYQQALDELVSLGFVGDSTQYSFFRQEA